ncbi:MAG: hypothetical protein E7252_08260 [Lachnospira sp.]|nr:hypothetical protein [Lachnospira sp.]
MTKRLKKIMSALVLATLVLSLTGQVVKAATSAIDDYYFYFDGAAGDIYDYSEGMQPKTNASYSYVTYPSYGGEKSFTAAVIGATLYGQYRENITLDSVRINPGEEEVIVHNWVYENDLPFAVLRGEADYDEIYTTEGTWEADAY